MKIQLLKTVRNVMRADSDPVRQALFDHLRTSNVVVKLVCTVHRLLHRLHVSSPLVFLFGVKSYITMEPSRREASQVLIVAIHKNAKKQSRKIAAWLGENNVVWLRVGLSQLLNPRAFGRLLFGSFRFRTWHRCYRVVKRVDREHGFLVSCRAASGLFSYLRAVELLRQLKPSGVIVSSDSNPEPLAFARAATARKVPTVFISHAYPTPVSPRLEYSLSILDGVAAREEYQSKGSIRGRVIYCGAEGDSAPMQAEKLTKKNPVVGIFAPKVIRWPQFVTLISECRQLCSPSQILIRWHPNMLGASRLSIELADLTDVVETDPKRSLQQISHRCDWVITDENSNVNLGVLKGGVPILPLRSFSVLPESRADLYGFVKNRIVPSSVASLSEVSLDELARFYTQDWAERFRRYDASYLGSPEQLAEQARNEILQALASTPRTPNPLEHE